MLLFKDLCEILAKYSGKCSTSIENKRFTMRVIYTLANRNGGNFSKQWCLLACNQCITAPTDLLTIDKIKIGGKVDRVWSQWVDYYDVGGSDWIECKGGVSRLPNTYPVVYDPPRPGFRLMAQPLADEDKDAHFIIQGRDIEGRPVYRERNGVDLAGDYISIKKETESTAPSATRTIFSEVTSIVKSPTKNLVRLLYVYPETKQAYLAGEYGPTETNPSYIRYRINRLQKGCCFDLNILGMVKIPTMYHDYDSVPVEDLDLIERVAKEIGHENNNEIGLANYMRDSSVSAIQLANNRKHEGNESPIDWVKDFTPRGDDFI
jgi:hypothetical protein